MKKLIQLLLALSVTMSAASSADDIFTYGDKAKNVHHIGDVWLRGLSRADDYYEMNIAAAKFAPGAVLNWHYHPAGQQVIIVDGKGYYQERGGEIQIVTKGDVIKCTPGKQHWHSAAKNEGVTYIAIGGNVPTEWFEPVDTAVYNSVE
mgnify:CR=1 FL=1